MSVFKCLTWTTRLDKILDEVQAGDMVRFHRGLFMHCAVYVGKGRAIHHHLGPTNGEVIEVTLEYLAKNDLMKVCPVYDTPFSRSEIVQRARSQIGLLPYSLHGGNCEHFTTWVYHGVRLSKQLINLGPYQRQLLQVVKHTPNADVESPQQQQQTPTTRSSTEVSLTKSAFSEQINASQRDTVETVSAEENDTAKENFVYIPPRPPKYRPAKNSAQLALNHTRSCLKVLTVQALVRLAALPLHRCGLQADNLRRIGRQLARNKKQRESTTISDENANVEVTPTASHSGGKSCSA